MRPKEFQKFIDRDLYCPHCGVTAPDLIPHHRANRGMGGDRTKNKQASQPANILAICAALNGLMESDSATMARAKDYGWKLSKHQDPANTPIYEAVKGAWFLLDNNYARTEMEKDNHANSQIRAEIRK